MNQEQNILKTEIEEPLSKPNPLVSVTPLSKYLAMALFIVMPFIGGWIGYNYSPVKVVEIEKVVTQDLEINNPEKYTSNNPEKSANKIFLFQFGCDAPSCLMLNTIDANDLVSEKTSIVTQGYLMLFGSIDRHKFFVTTTEKNLHIKEHTVMP